MGELIRTALMDVTAPETEYRIRCDMKYSDLENISYKLFERSKSVWSVHFHDSLADVEEKRCRWILQSVQWEDQDYRNFNKTDKGDLLLYAHFIPASNGTSGESRPRRPAQGSRVTTRAASVAESIDPLNPNDCLGQTNISPPETVNEFPVTDELDEQEYRNNRSINSVETDLSEVQGGRALRNRLAPPRRPGSKYRFTREDDRYLIESRCVHKRSWQDTKDGNPKRPEWKNWDRATFRRHWSLNLAKRSSV